MAKKPGRMRSAYNETRRGFKEARLNSRMAAPTPTSRAQAAGRRAGTAVNRAQATGRRAAGEVGGAARRAGGAVGGAVMGLVQRSAAQISAARRNLAVARARRRGRGTRTGA